MSRTIVVLTSGHPPDDIRVFQKSCRSLAEVGYGVLLVVPGEGPTEKDGVKLSYVPKPATRWARLFVTPFQILRIAVKERPDAYHLHDPDLILVGLALKLRSKVVLDVHEDLRKQILSMWWIPRILRRPLSVVAAGLEWLSMKVFDGFVVVTPAIAARFPKEKTALVQNYPRLGDLDIPNVSNPASGAPTLVYIGGVTLIRGATEMVEAMDLVDPSLQATLRIIGPMNPPELQSVLNRLPGWTHIDYVAWQERDVLARTLSAAKAGLVLFHPEPNHVEAQPNKLFEYMAAGLPVIASDFPLWREIIEETKCGLLVDPMDASAIAEAIEWLVTHGEEATEMGLSGQRAVRAELNWATQAQELASFYERIFSPAQTTNE